MAQSFLFPASVVGSLPRPKFVQDIILSDSDPFSSLMDTAVQYVIALQEHAGVDIISDGEWRRKSYIGVIAQIASGFEHYFDDGRTWHIVTTRLEHISPGFFAREVKFLKQHTNKKVKVCMPSPYLLGVRMWDAERSRDAYPLRRDFITALIPILRKELLLAKDAGADVIQIDDPHICLFVDPKTRAEYKNPDDELRYACRAVHEVTQGIGGVERALHLCRRNKGRRGWIGEGSYDAIIPFISEIDLDQFVLEYSIPSAGDIQALAKLPERFTIGFGCVDCRFEHIESPLEIAQRVERALLFVPPERIVLNPDCGFAPSSQAEIPLDEAYEKLKNEVAVARMLREKYA